MLSIIENDLFDIASRISTIDDCYFVAFNNRLKRFEVHDKTQRGATLAVVLPYNRLDVRAVRHVLRTRIERQKEIIEEIERHNERLEKEATKRVLDNAAAKAFG